MDQIRKEKIEEGVNSLFDKLDDNWSGLTRSTKSWKKIFKKYLQEYPEPDSPIDRAFLREVDLVVPEEDEEEVYPIHDQLAKNLLSLRDKINDEITKEVIKSKGLEARQSGLLQEIADNAPTIVYKPGSKWVPREAKWAPDKRSVIREIEELPKRSSGTVIKPKPSVWKESQIICSQLGEFRKDELIHMAWELGIGTYIDPRWNKDKICKILGKHMAVLIH